MDHVAIGNSEPLPEWLFETGKESLLGIIRASRSAAGFNDQGEKVDP